jgi:hypothetical protein
MDNEFDILYSYLKVALATKDISISNNCLIVFISRGSNGMSIYSDDFNVNSILHTCNVFEHISLGDTPFINDIRSIILEYNTIVRNRKINKIL